MQVILVAMAVTMFILFLICLTPIIVEIKVLKEKRNDEVIVYFKAFYGLAKYKLELPKIDYTIKDAKDPGLKVESEIEKGKNQDFLQDRSSFMDLDKIQSVQDNIDKYYNQYYDILNFLRKRMVINQLCWKTEFGTGDAAVTGILTGIIWALKGNIAALIERHIHCKKISLDINPTFNKEILNTHIDCIISLKIGYIIIASLKLGYRFFKKGGEQNGKSSN